MLKLLQMFFLAKAAPPFQL